MHAEDLGGLIPGGEAGESGRVVPPLVAHDPRAVDEKVGVVVGVPERPCGDAAAGRVSTEEAGEVGPKAGLVTVGNGR